ncbi:MAG: hypothetical protein B6U88_01835 [Candidatus Aenigmarchaeota archaeon ex4484_56]|nr:MAG: hypothetical protein B6U88_01835 [Candidatus Aenigmarchaeota archaeon ex4484_56]
MELIKKQKILVYSLFFALFVLLIGLIISYISNNLSVISYFVFISIFCIIIPLFIKRYIHFLEIKDCENYISVFLEDLKEIKKSGMSFPDAIKNCKGDYGKLTKYINKLQNDLSWGVSIDDALKIMRNNLKESKIISRTISILIEIYRSGGNIEEILNTLIHSLIKITESEEYKKSVMMEHVYMMYAIFFLYTGLIIAMGKLLIPMIANVQQADVGYTSTQVDLFKASSPCSTGKYNLLVYGICSLYNFIGSAFNFGEPNSLQVYYRSLFFTMTLIQAVCTGLIAGQISSKSWISGVKHGLIMFILGFVIIVVANSFGYF